MKTLITTLLASIAFVGVAFAGETQGTVQSVDTASMKLVLEDGSQFAINDNVSLDDIKAGTAVKIVFDDATNTVTEIVPM